MTPRTVVIDAKERSSLARFRAVWDAKALLYYLVRRDLHGRYRPTTLGRLWIVVRPAMEVATYMVVFGIFLGISSTEMPYPLFLCAGLVPWLFFHQTVGGSADTLASARHLMSKVSFPRIIVPLNNLLLALIDLLVLFAIVLVLALAYRTPMGWPIFALPLFLAMLVMLAFGASLIVASWSVSSPDIALIVPTALRVFMYLSPIVYPPTRVPEAWRFIYDLNPIATIVTAIRWTIGAQLAPGALQIAFAALLTAAVLVGGLVAFSRSERRMIDFL
jgi:lipopolysaccharide transport system permease protein